MVPKQLWFWIWKVGTSWNVLASDFSKVLLIVLVSWCLFFTLKMLKLTGINAVDCRIISLPKKNVLAEVESFCAPLHWKGAQFCVLCGWFFNKKNKSCNQFKRNKEICVVLLLLQRSFSYYYWTTIIYTFLCSKK